MTWTAALLDKMLLFSYMTKYKISVHVETVDQLNIFWFIYLSDIPPHFMPVFLLEQPGQLHDGRVIVGVVTDGGRSLHKLSPLSSCAIQLKREGIAQELKGSVWISSYVSIFMC